MVTNGNNERFKSLFYLQIESKRVRRWTLKYIDAKSCFFFIKIYSIIAITNRSKIKEIARKITPTNGQLYEFTIFNNDLMEI